MMVATMIVGGMLALLFLFMAHRSRARRLAAVATLRVDWSEAWFVERCAELGLPQDLSRECLVTVQSEIAGDGFPLHLDDDLIELFVLDEEDIDDLMKLLLSRGAVERTPSDFSTPASMRRLIEHVARARGLEGRDKKWN